MEESGNKIRVAFTIKTVSKINSKLSCQKGWNALVGCSAFEDRYKLPVVALGI